MIEGRTYAQQAIANFEPSFDFADMLHHASHKDCINIVSFDNKKFARQAKRNGLISSILVPK
jgi:hypothetical protein